MEVDYIEMAILELEKRNSISAAFARTMYNGMKSRIAQLEAAQHSVQADAATSPHVCDFSNSFHCPACGRACF